MQKEGLTGPPLLFEAHRSLRYNADMSKSATSYRLSPKALELLRLLAEEMGVSRTSVIEIGIRELAKKHGVETE